MYRSRGPRVWPALGASLLVAFALSQWLGGVYVTPPRHGGVPGRTALVWRASGEPFFNSAAVPGFEDGPGGTVLVGDLPFWSYAYRQSLKAAARIETVTVGAARPDASPAARPAGTPAAEPDATVPPPARPEAAAPPTSARPKTAAPRTSPAAVVRPVASPSAPAGVTPERDRRLDRIRRELERIRREGVGPSAAGPVGPGTGG